MRDRLPLFFAACYLAQGMSGLIYEPLSYLLKDELKLSPAQSGAFVTAMTAPLLFKPLLGLLSDALPLPGRRRRIVLLLAASAHALCLLALAGVPSRWGVLLGLLVAVNIATVLIDAVCDAVMVEQGKPTGSTGRFQAVQLGVLYACLVATGIGGGYLTARLPARAIFGLAAVFPLLALGSAVWLREPSVPAAPARAVAGLKELLRRRESWALAAMIFLWSFAPALGTAQFYFQTQRLGLGPLAVGSLSTVAGLAGMAGAALYWRMVGRRWSLEQIARAAVWAWAPLSLLYLLYRGPLSAGAVTALLAAAGIVFRLSLMDLAARLCPKGAEASSFAAFMAVFNLAASASNACGAWLYGRLSAGWGADGAWTALTLLGAAATLCCRPFLRLVLPSLAAQGATTTAN